MFEHWHEYYLLVGGAAGALIGLLFVVATLTANFPRDRAMRGVRLFMTPTLFDLGVVLAISGSAMAPEISGGVEAWFVGAAALAGAAFSAYAGVAILQPGRHEHWSDPLCYGALPLLIYIALGLDAWALRQGRPDAPAWLAGITMALLLMAIRNAWDLVTWMAPRGDPPAA
jgi:hypothetical protein